MAFNVFFATRPDQERLYGNFRVDLAVKDLSLVWYFWSTELFVSGEFTQIQF